MLMANTLDYIAVYYDDSDYWLSPQERRGSGMRSLRPDRNPMSRASYLSQHIRFIIRTATSKCESVDTETGGTCLVYDKRQVRLPIPIRRCLNSAEAELLTRYGQFWNPQNVTVHWLVAYLHRNFPDSTKAGWENFSCSHRCLSGSLKSTDRPCLVAEHLVWEPHSVNLARGYRICRARCKHCNQMLCHCQSIHIPPCL
jgi:hypothetical protein